MTVSIKTSTELVIRCFYTVYNALGYGFLERVYENALLMELQQQGIPCVRQAPIQVFYQGKSVGNYYADILINNELILELKAAECIMPAHEAQLINYLKATQVEVGFVFVFGPKPQFVPKVFSNSRKKHTLNPPYPCHSRSTKPCVSPLSFPFTTAPTNCASCCRA